MVRDREHVVSVVKGGRGEGFCGEVRLAVGLGRAVDGRGRAPHLVEEHSALWLRTLRGGEGGTLETGLGLEHSGTTLTLFWHNPPNSMIP